MRASATPGLGAGGLRKRAASAGRQAGVPFMPGGRCHAPQHTGSAPSYGVVRAIPAASLAIAHRAQGHFGVHVNLMETGDRSPSGGATSRDLWSMSRLLGEPHLVARGIALRPLLGDAVPHELRAAHAPMVEAFGSGPRDEDGARARSRVEQRAERAMCPRPAAGAHAALSCARRHGAAWRES